MTHYGGESLARYENPDALGKSVNFYLRENFGVTELSMATSEELAAAILGVAVERVDTLKTLPGMLVLEAAFKNTFEYLAPRLPRETVEDAMNVGFALWRKRNESLEE